MKVILYIILIPLTLLDIMWTYTVVALGTYLAAKLEKYD